MSTVLKAEDILNAPTALNTNPNKTKSKKKKSKKKRNSNSSDSDSDDGTFVQMRGRIVSGRFWKSQKTRASSIIRTPGLRSSFKQKQILREELKRVKELSRSLEQERIQAKLLKKQRREDNLRRAEINRKKNEIVQAIKDSAKIKKMKKSQLKKIEKRDITKVVK